MYPNKINFPHQQMSKYRNQTCKCIQGHIHHSRGEAQYCTKLYAMMQHQEIRSYEIQKCYRLDVNGHHICNHYVDFLVFMNDGKQEVHEFKGFATTEWMLKKRLFEAVYPDIPYIVIKYQWRKR